MKLQYRLFLSVGIIFLLAFLASLYLENRLIDRYLERSEHVKLIHEISSIMRLISSIMLLIVLVVLQRISAYTTKPIVALAKASEKVGAGDLENIVIPDGRSDEIGTLCKEFRKMVEGLKERNKVEGILNKVVSPAVAHQILEQGVKLGGEDRIVTVLFGDIRHFTQKSSVRSADQTISILNECMTRIARVVDEMGGVIDKFVGDEIMALFGAPLKKKDDPLSAVECAWKMVQVLKGWNQERAKNGEKPVEMGFGVHTGNVVAGNMGAENRLNYTVVGSNVNFAFRLCEKAAGMEILISQETLDQPGVRDRFITEKKDGIVLKGFEGTQTLYAVTGVKHGH